MPYADANSNELPLTPPQHLGLDPRKYGTHLLRRTKAALIYKKTGDLRAVQLLLGHTKLETAVRYPGVEVDDALRISEQIELRVTVWGSAWVNCLNLSPPANVVYGSAG